MISAAWAARSRFAFCLIIGFEVALAMGRLNRCKIDLARAQRILWTSCWLVISSLKPWQAGADEIGEIRGITRLNGSFVNQGPGFKFRKRQVTR
jgi:hypothetical protein